ncbi:MAG TPA: hypothetical protein VGH21_06775 [Solirubrobacteraceae bacterium]|jgi:hypothetical protein
MSAFFNSLKSDLLDRRVVPLLAVLGLAVLGAIAYAVLAGGSGSSAAPVANAPIAAPAAPGIAVSAVKANPDTSVDETTSGSAKQTRGASRNPFKPLPGAQQASTSGAAASSTSDSGSTAGGSSTSGSEAEGSGSGSESSSSAQGGTSPQPERKKPSQPAKPQTVYKVSVLFGTAPAGSSTPSVGLTPYNGLKRQQPLPSSTAPLIVFRGVVVGGKSATFTIVGEAIPRGNGACLPSASQCTAIDVKVGDTEELEYVPLEGTPTTYQLQVVKIEAVKGKAAGAARAASADDAFDGESQAGVKFLRESGLSALPGLRYSRDGSVLVFTGVDRAHAAARAATARAHASA